jgi:hypothetical protein
LTFKERLGTYLDARIANTVKRAFTLSGPGKLIYPEIAKGIINKGRRRRLNSQTQSPAAAEFSLASVNSWCIFWG